MCVVGGGGGGDGGGFRLVGKKTGITPTLLVLEFQDAP